ncbi:PTS sugar transporter subunit IIA [Anaerocolumna xylanovorans]|uniref:PTS system, glucose subfamily, IIA component n=1 Tax=Anaerocolumna xylanovorans DSM 12503 TaxID=1121345 RepID=A0A1M7Y0Q0_9FIRM|nr:glucose PTS transporter subunit IIA [Anaerocolumna xylanovorans]SHO45264.1 PTS system, glucose subfamily, IIA component [Anaerocolumna xylanovorans DSM 12503]
MGLLDNIFQKKTQISVFSDEDILAVANAVMVPASGISDATFREELMGQTIGFDLKDGTVVSPVNGELEVLFATGHAFAVRMVDGTGLLVHIGIDTVHLNGAGFKTLAKQGELVKAGQPIVKVDIDAVKKAGYECVTMLIVTEPVTEGARIPFIAFGNVTRGQIIIEK